WDRSARLWDVATGEMIRIFEHDYGLEAVAFSPDGKWILTGTHDTTARLWDAATGELLRILSGNTDSAAKAVFAPDDKSVYTSSWDGIIRQWNLGQDERVFSLPANPINDGFFTADGQSILFASFEGNAARLMDARTGRELTRFSGHQYKITSMIIS